MSTPVAFSPKLLAPISLAESTVSSDSAKNRTMAIPDGRDALSLSREAQIQRESQTEETSGNVWRSRYGFREGTTTLANGRTQVVSFEDNQMHLQEYKGGRLVKKMTGTTDGETMTTDVEHYDDNGRITQTVRTTLTGLGDNASKHTTAAMHRSIQWYDHGEIIREMTDSTTLDASYVRIGTDAFGTTATSLQDMVNHMTDDSLHLSYRADLQEYEDGKLRRTAQASYMADSWRQTNRTGKFNSGQNPGTSKMQNGKSAISYSMTEYDQDGERLREASFSDRIDTRKKQFGEVPVLKQELSVRWFSQGELVKNSHGTLTAEQSRTQPLPGRRPNLLSSTHVPVEEYAGDKPLAAGEMLASGFMRHDGDAATGMALNQYEDAGDANAQFNGKGPYQVSMESETYRDGKIVARQTDSERAQKNVLPVENRFRTGGSLTEDDVPGILLSSEHGEESYRDGVSEKKAVLRSHEAMNRDDNGVLFVETVQHGTMTENGQGKTLTNVLRAGLVQTDQERGNARTAWTSEAGPTVAAMLQAMGTRP